MPINSDSAGLQIQDLDTAATIHLTMIKYSSPIPLVTLSRSSQAATIPKDRGPSAGKGRARGFFRAIFAGLVLLSLVGCETTISTKLPEGDAVRGPVTLTPGDVVKLTFPGATELNQSQKIQADGKINLPMVGEVNAGGRTLSDLQQQLEVLYRPQLQNTTVVVTLESSATVVVLGGSVTKPGKYMFDRPTTILQAIMEAGGPDRFGTLGRVSVIRLVNGQQRTEVVDLQPILRGSPTRPFYVRTGDIVLVGESRF